jgi:predicted nuclease of predicted toxin-antitoxin system
VLLLANENIPGEAVKALRANGHDVSWVRTEAPGISDQEVLAWAKREYRVILTFDKDFGELAFRSRLATSGVILFRIPTHSPSFVASVAVAALASRSDWEGHFAVIQEGQIRMTPLPSEPS